MPLCHWDFKPFLNPLDQLSPKSKKKKFAVLICASASNDGGNDEELGKSNCLRGPAFPQGKTEFLFLGGDIFDNQI